MRSFWMLRSDLRILESYHKYDNLEEFKKSCWDYYLLMVIWFIENNYIDEGIIWRLNPKNKKLNDILFDIQGKFFIQKWVDSFQEIYKYSPADITLFRGGFKYYDEVVKGNKRIFGKKLYLGAGMRTTPQYGGKYDLILVEDERDIKDGFIPFYKTANPNIFRPFNNPNKKYDICWPHNFSTIRYKGADFFFSKMSNCPFLKGLKIVHAGNQPNIGYKFCDKYKIGNIEFVDRLTRLELNDLLNESRFGLVTSNLNDGCPRISTEILSSGTPLLIRNTTRLMNFYKRKGVIQFSDKNIINVINKAFVNYDKYSEEVSEVIKNKLSFDEICKKNIDLWIK